MTALKKIFADKEWKFSEISSARNAMMGFAALLIVLFHSPIDKSAFNYAAVSGKILYLLVKSIVHSANFGVDIFLILSGFGLFYSFSKNQDVLPFYKKRLLKVAIPVLIASAAMNLFIFKYSGLKFVRHFLLLAFPLDGDRFLWYFALLIPLYIIFPLLYRLIDKGGFKSTAMLILGVLAVNFTMFFLWYDEYQKIEIAVTRIPAFILGIYFGKLSAEGKAISGKALKLTYVLFAVFLIVKNYLELFAGLPLKYYFPERYLTVGIAVTAVIIFSQIYSNVDLHRAKKLLVFFGSISLEIYLFYERFLKVFADVFPELKQINCLYNFVIFLITIAVSFAYNRLTQGLLFKK